MDRGTRTSNGIITALGLKRNLLRPGREAGEASVSEIELFYDLVFVFAVAQLSDLLIEHHTPLALLQTVILASAMWRVWIDTVWVTNWMDPRKVPVGAGILVTAGLALILSSAIPHAFERQGWLFAVPVVMVQVGRSILTAWGMALHWSQNAVSFVRIGVWHSVSGTLWLAGAALSPDERLWVWFAAAVVEQIGPRALFWVPGLGATSIDTWDVHPDHLSERVGLFVIIALGESIVLTGQRMTDDPPHGGTHWSMLAAFASTIACYLLFFRRSHERAAANFAADAHPGRVAQIAYTYVPLVLVLGIVGIAVGDELVLADPYGGTDLWMALMVCATCSVYLVGNALFQRSTGGEWSVPHLVGALACAAMVWPGMTVNPLTLSWLVNLVLFTVVAADEWRSRSDEALTRA